MKKDLHPEYNKPVTVTCSCGNTFATGSTLQAINIEICSNCHPFYTGQQKLIDTAGRVDRFQEKMAKREAMVGQRKGRKVKREETKTAKAKKAESKAKA
jgi:large subunit ribosomal protein L31